MNSTEAELESFRQKWKEEVSQRAKGKQPATSTKSSEASSSRSQAPKSTRPEIPTDKPRISTEDVDDVEPHVYHDVGEEQSGRKLGDTSTPSARSSKEPQSALEHYEKAVEKETQGKMGDSVNLYRKAFRLDAKVHDIYKAKHFPPSSFQAQKPKPQDVNPPNASVTVPNTAHHSLEGLPSSLHTLIEEFSGLSIQGEALPTDLSLPPPCPIASIPEELLSEILLYIAVRDVASFTRLAQVCKRLAYLVLTEDKIWKRVSLGDEVGFGAMHYTYACNIDGKPIGDDGEGGLLLSSASISDEEEKEEEAPPPLPSLLTALLVPNPYPTYRSLFRRRPRIRFNGCYISTVNYTRPGASSPTSVSWNTPIHIVTYYRYLRFLRNGTVISLLTVAEPADVIPYLHPEHLHKNHTGALPQAVMKDALPGRWRLSGPYVPSLATADPEAAQEEEGTLHVETAGSTPKYIFKMVFSMASAGRGARNNKLAWKGFWSYNKLTDDWAEFGLKNDKQFYWSRVKSYGMGL